MRPPKFLVWADVGATVFGMEHLTNAIARIEERLTAMDRKLDTVAASRTKSMEWLAQMSEHVRSLDQFREEVRASLEPLFEKIENLDEVIRIMRHATLDVARRVEQLELRRAG